MAQSRFETCPLYTFEKMISGKWMIPVLREIKQEGTARFGALLRCFPEITKATLTKQLRKLEETGFIERREEEGYPRIVEYSLSPLGAEFLDAFVKIEDWFEAYLKNKAEKEALTATEN